MTAINKTVSVQALRDALADAVAEEREACARLVEQTIPFVQSESIVAKEIRRRGAP